MGRLGTLLVGILLLVTAIGTVVAPPKAEALDRSAGTESELKSVLAELSENTNGPHSVTLTADITLSDGHAVYSGTQDLTIDGDGHSVSGNDASRVFYFPILDGVTVTLTNMIVENGRGSGEGSGGAGIKVNASGTNGGDLVVINSVVRNNFTTEDGGGIAVSYGGDLTLIDSMVLDNRGEDGGGVTGSHVEVIRSTVANNQADSWEAGGGIFGGSVTLVNSTVTGNSAGDGSGVYSRGPLSMTYSTVSNNNGPGANIQVTDIGSGMASFGSVVADAGTVNCLIVGGTVSTYSYDDDGTCGFADPTDVSSGSDPLLGDLADNDGATWTRLPGGPGDPLVDRIPAASCDAAVTTDQRGVARPEGSGCDIGAVEAFVPTQPSPAYISANLSYGEISLWGFEEGPVQVDVSNPEDPEQAWSGEVDGEVFPEQLGFPLLPGMVITAGDRELVIPEGLTYDTYDIANQVVAGGAPDGVVAVVFGGPMRSRRRGHRRQVVVRRLVVGVRRIRTRAKPGGRCQVPRGRRRRGHCLIPVAPVRRQLRGTTGFQ